MEAQYVAFPDKIIPPRPMTDTIDAPFDPTHGSVVHLVSEYWPFARTGGLAEAVRGIAHFQVLAGFPTQIVLPLYRGIRSAFPDVEPCSEPFPVPVGGMEHMARMHRYRAGPDEPTVYFVEHDGFFDRDRIYGDEHGDYRDNPLRFAFYCRAALAWLPRIASDRTLIHAHDWHASLAGILLRAVLDDADYYRHIPVVLTAHNAGYQGQYDHAVIHELGLPGWLDSDDWLTWEGRANLLRAGLATAEMVTTVSPTHAAELRTQYGGFGLHSIFAGMGNRFQGILNGIDTEVWDPSADLEIAARYSADDISGKAVNKAELQERARLPVDPDVPVFAMTARLAQQKGFDILLESGAVGTLEAQWIFLGEGEARYRDALQGLAHAHPDRVAPFFVFSEDQEHRLLAGADFLLMPSLYEPCGLTQMRAQRYGAIPIVRRVGGLADTVEDRVTGFLFDEYEPWALREAVEYAVDLYRDRPQWEEWVREAMARDFSWESSVVQYQAVYARAHELREQALVGAGA